MKNKFILASKSPRRQELFKIITDDFECVVSNVAENYPPELSKEAVPEYLACKKAEAVAKAYPSNVVVGCDTCVFIDNEILGKPVDKSDAFRMLKKLSGKSHKVITGCAIYKKDKISSFSVDAEVKFREITDAEIEEYINTDEPMDKAGAYGIQGKGALFVEDIFGDYYSVMGLPLCRLSVELKKL